MPLTLGTQPSLYLDVISMLWHLFQRNYLVEEKLDLLTITIHSAHLPQLVSFLLFLFSFLTVYFSLFFFIILILKMPPCYTISSLFITLCWKQWWVCDLFPPFSLSLLPSLQFCFFLSLYCLYLLPLLSLFIKFI